MGQVAELGAEVGNRGGVNQQDDGAAAAQVSPQRKAGAQEEQVEVMRLARIDHRTPDSAVNRQVSGLRECAHRENCSAPARPDRRKLKVISVWHLLFLTPCNRR